MLNSLLSCLPPSLGQLAELQTLTIIECNITRLPEELGLLKKLKQIRLSRCYRLRLLPESLGQLAGLNMLAISECPLIVLPNSIGSLSSLRSLSLYACELLTRLPESLGQLTALRTLDITSSAALTSLPASLRQLTALEHLTITDCTFLAELPETISYLSLSQLTVNWGWYGKIPGHVSHPKGSVELRSSNVKICNLTNYFQTIMTMAICMRRRHARLVRLPSEILWAIHESLQNMSAVQITFPSVA
jgi:Leucine-rich repeat (LRR) protein